jgi:hypothetical protein
MRNTKYKLIIIDFIIQIIALNVITFIFYGSF